MKKTAALLLAITAAGCAPVDFGGWGNDYPELRPGVCDDCVAVPCYKLNDSMQHVRMSEHERDVYQSKIPHDSKVYRAQCK